MDIKLDIIDLGCMNGWGANKPAEYVNHVHNCGEPMYDMMPDAEDNYPRNYILTTRRELAPNYHEVRCLQCGIKFTVDSSG